MVNKSIQVKMFPKTHKTLKFEINKIKSKIISYQKVIFHKIKTSKIKNHK